MRLRRRPAPSVGVPASRRGVRARPRLVVPSDRPAPRRAGRASTAIDPGRGRGSARDRRAARIDVVGLGPAGPELITAGTLELLAAAPRPCSCAPVATRRPPPSPGAGTFDHHYESADTFDEVYRAIVDGPGGRRARPGAPVVYAVPGSPTVAERTVVPAGRDHPGGGRARSPWSSIRRSPSSTWPSPGWASIRWPRASGWWTARRFAVDAAGERGPLLVAQCWSRQVLSDVKLSVERRPDAPGHRSCTTWACPTSRCVEVAWDDLDRSLEPDHLTSLWIPRLAAPVAAELVALDELVHTLRERCPWDRRQTHGSLARHLLEESYEVLEAIDAVAAVERPASGPAGRPAPGPDAADEERAVAHLEEELGDLLFQVYFHATLAAEEGRFTLADVARGVHDKLVSRHPHVFGDVTAETADDVAANWEAHQEGREGPGQRDRGDPGRPARPGPGGQAPAQGRGRRHGAARTGRRGARVADAAWPAWPTMPGDRRSRGRRRAGARGPGRGGGGPALPRWPIGPGAGRRPRDGPAGPVGRPSAPRSRPAAEPVAARRRRSPAGAGPCGEFPGPRGWSGGSVSHTASRSDCATVSLIEQVIGREVLDSRGNPTVEVEVVLDSGASGRAIVPSGASTGILRGRRAARRRRPLRGQGRPRRPWPTSTARSPSSSTGFDALDQRAVDLAMIDADGTPNKGRLGANAILGVSLATARAAADELGPAALPLRGRGRRPRAAGADDERGQRRRPRRQLHRPPGVHDHAGRGGLVRRGPAVGGRDLPRPGRGAARPRPVHRGGRRGRLRPEPAPPTRTPCGSWSRPSRRPAGCPGDEIAIAMDPATSELYRGRAPTCWPARGGRCRRTRWSTYWVDLVDRYPIVSIEDGMAEDDWDGWAALTAALGDRVQLVGDDLFVTNEERLRRGIDAGTANAILIKVNQIGTLTETLGTMDAGHPLRLRLRDVPPLGRDRGHHHRRPGRGHQLRPDQDRRPGPLRPGGQVQPAAADRGAARRVGRLPGRCGAVARGAGTVSRGLPRPLEAQAVGAAPIVQRVHRADRGHRGRTGPSDGHHRGSHGMPPRSRPDGRPAAHRFTASAAAPDDETGGAPDPAADPSGGPGPIRPSARAVASSAGPDRRPARGGRGPSAASGPLRVQPEGPERGEVGSRVAEIPRDQAGGGRGGLGGGGVQGGDGGQVGGSGARTRADGTDTATSERPADARPPVTTTPRASRASKGGSRWRSGPTRLRLPGRPPRDPLTGPEPMGRGRMTPGPAG